MAGYVYVMTNKAMPGLVKIGYCTIDPYDRAKQLRTTGVPTKFEVYGYVRVNNPKIVEKAVHSELSEFRKYRSREFFKIKPENAVKTLEQVSGECELKRKQECEEAERLKKIEAERIRRTEFEKDFFEYFESLCRKLEKKTHIKLYQNVRFVCQMLCYFVFIIIFALFAYIKNRNLEPYLMLGSVWAFNLSLSMINGKIASNKFKKIETDVCSEMERCFSRNWFAYKEKCVDRLYDKYVRHNI